MKGIFVVALMMVTSLVKAQSLDDGIKMYNYERYQSSKQILQMLAATNPLANYYLGLCEIGLENDAAAKTIFQKYPDDVANNAGIARVMFNEKQSAEAMSMLTKVASKAKKKDWLPLKYAADAITYTEGGDPNVAVEWYKKALEVEKNGNTYLAMGDAYRKMQGGTFPKSSEDVFVQYKYLLKYTKSLLCRTPLL